MAFIFTPIDALPDVVMIETKRHGDDRGWFLEAYKRSAFAEGGIRGDFSQDNHSMSVAPGTLRGLHYQAEPFGQGKLIRVVAGEIFDVAVDLRRGSPTFGRWMSVVLRDLDPKMLWIPGGFAHGFQTLVPDTVVIYKTTAEYSPAHERGILWSDPALAIPWPVASPFLSERDRHWPVLASVP